MAGDRRFLQVDVISNRYPAAIDTGTIMLGKDLPIVMECVEYKL